MNTDSRAVAGRSRHQASGSPAVLATVGLLRVADRIRRRIDRLMEPYGITGQQYNVLRILRGTHPETLPTLEIAERMIEQTPGITRLLDRLERKGLVERRRCTEDRRCVLCSITPAGLRLLEELDEAVEELDEAVIEPLERHEAEQLVEYLERLQADPPS